METDSILTVQGIRSSTENCLEVGEVFESCRLQLQHLTGVSILFIRKQANRVAHEISRIPCLANCQKLFYVSSYLFVGDYFARLAGLMKFFFDSKKKNYA